MECLYEEDTRERKRRRRRYNDDDDDDEDNNNKKTKNNTFINDFTRWNDCYVKSREMNKIINRRFWKSNIYKEELSLLHLAVENENVEIVKLLLRNDKIDVNQIMTSYYNTKNSYRRTRYKKRRKNSITYCCRKRKF